MAASLYDHLLTFTGLNRHRQVRRKGKTPTAEHAPDTAQPHSLGLLAKVAADEAVCAIRRMLMRSFSREDWHRIAQEVRTAARTFAAEGWLERPIRYHRTPPVLDHPDTARAHAGGVDFMHLSFDSAYEPYPSEPGRARWLAYAGNRRAHAWVLQHRGRPRPWLVCIHGYGMGAPFVDFAGFQAAWLYGRLGFNLLLPVQPFHGPRKLGWRSGEGFFSGDCLDTVHAEAQAIWDIRRLLTWIRTQEAPAVGLYGLSLGGYAAALLACLDADLACVIAGIPATDFVRLARRHTPLGLQRDAEQQGLDWDALEQVFRVISPLAMSARVPRSRRYLFAGTADRLVPPDQVQDLWEHWGRPHITWYTGSHLSFAWEPEVRMLLRDTLRAEMGPFMTRPVRACVRPARARLARA